jgi:hypothetical protein
VSRGIDAIRSYYRQVKAEGKDELFEAKLLIVGEPGSGKTTLAQKIMDLNYQLREEKSTEGIDIHQWTFPVEGSREFRVNIWDFGGQEIYHATHQFFLTKRSLYALVADDRREDTDFYYWLNAVELFSDNSPVLIIKNEKQDRIRQIPESQLRERFSNIEDMLATNLATNRGLSDIRDRIAYCMRHLPHVGDILPKKWVAVRKKLEEDPRSYISIDEYLQVCEENGFANREDQLQLSAYLHDLGVFLHFQDDPLLKRTVILQPEWGTSAVYAVLDNEEVKKNHGEFDRSHLRAIWSDEQYVDMHDELLGLMMRFELCYEIPGESGRYIAPQLLDKSRPEYEWDPTDNLLVRYTYESFMPKGVVSRFMVAMHKHITDQRLAWQHGVVLQKDGGRAEIIEDLDRRQIRIRVAGRNRRALLTIIAFQLDALHESFHRLRYGKMIPCNCAQCAPASEPYFIPLDVLQDFRARGIPQVQCQKSGNMTDVSTLIDDAAPAGPAYDNGMSGMKGVFIDTRGGDVHMQSTQRGDIMVESTDMSDQAKHTDIIYRSAWANGSFYAFLFALIIAGLAVLGTILPAYVLAIVLIAAVILVPIIGGLELARNRQLSEKGFLELMQLAIAQLPLIAKLAKRHGIPPTGGKQE